MNQQVKNQLVKLTADSGVGRRVAHNRPDNRMVWRPKRKFTPVVNSSITNTNPPLAMDGVEPEHNVVHVPRDEWAIDSDIAEAADNFVNGIIDPNLQFVREGGADMILAMEMFDDLLDFLWNISFGRYIPRILNADMPVNNFQLPLNPLAVFNQVMTAIMLHWSTTVQIVPIQSHLREIICEGLFIPSDFWNEYASVLAADKVSGNGSASHNTVVALEGMVDGVAQQDTDNDQAHCLNIHVPATLVGPNQMIVFDQAQIASSQSPDPLPPVVESSTHFGRMISKETKHVDTAQLRRSTRSTRYDGFRVPQPSDVRITVSKVKQRVNPAVAVISNATAPHMADSNVKTDAPPPTTI